MSVLQKLTARQQKGAQAEQLAQQFLEQQGLQFITKNFRCKQGEIDLIMQDNDTIVFIEVRHRVRTDFGSAAESVTVSKQTKVIKTATLFMIQQKWYQQKAVRFDVVTLQGALLEAPELNWIKQAFY
ncbi:MAG: YraN family protein [Gammaproteobacteria bacterium]